MNDVRDSMELSGPIAPPIANGEVIFDAPWQSRAFGMARVMCEAGHYTWDEFRQRLIARIEEWEATQLDQADTTEYHYFNCFLSALADVLNQTGLCEAKNLSAREKAFAARPHGHDH